MPDLSRTIVDIVRAAQKPAGDRAARYGARLDAHLETLPASQRRGFLDREEAKWAENYREWAKRVDTGTATERELTYSAWDFTLTIAEIGRRQAKYAPVAP